MHRYIVIDIVEVYEEEKNPSMFENILLPSDHKFVEHRYLLECEECEKKRLVREDTFVKLVENRLVWRGE